MNYTEELLLEVYKTNKFIYLLLTRVQNEPDYDSEYIIGFIKGYLSHIDRKILKVDSYSELLKNELYKALV